MKRVAVIGTGIMGGHFARNLAASGFAVTAWNRSREKLAPLAADGIQCCGSARAAMAGAEVVIVMLSTGAVVDEVMFSASEGGMPAISVLAPGTLIIVMSSIPVETARRQGTLAKASGMRYLDAPVSGGEPGARDGVLAIFAGGSHDDFADAQSVFKPLGNASLLGPVGSGQLTKLANQVIVGGTLVAISEALTLARSGGADPVAVQQALLGGFGDSKVLRVLGPRMVSEDFTPGSPAAYQLKDMLAAKSLSENFGLNLRMLKYVISLFDGVIARDEGRLDVSVIVREVARSACVPQEAATKEDEA